MKSFVYFPITRRKLGLSRVAGVALALILAHMSAFVAAVLL